MARDDFTTRTIPNTTDGKFVKIKEILDQRNVDNGGFGKISVQDVMDMLATQWLQKEQK